MKTIIKGGWVVDPAQNINKPADVLINEGRIEKIDDVIDIENFEIIDAKGLYVVPGLIDIHVHFRDPGYPEKETIETGSNAAVAGGFTSVVCMPNTKPTIDSVEIINYINEKVKKASCNIYMMGSITKGLNGSELSSYEEMMSLGIAGITDDGKTVMETKTIYKAMQKAAELDLLVSEHCEDSTLVYDRTINRGLISEKLGLEGLPALAEDIVILRDTLLAKETGAKLHIQHLSTKTGVDIVREAKKRSIDVSCEVTPHHILLTDEAVIKKGSLAKMSPPLRAQEDIDAIIFGLKDGTIDIIATDHAPHTSEEKDKNLINAPNGIVGLETALGIILTELVHKNHLTFEEVIRKMTLNPARRLKLDKGSLKVGDDADITIIDLNKKWIVRSECFRSMSNNMPFEELELMGKAVCTLVDGKVKYSLSNS